MKYETDLEVVVEEVHMYPAVAFSMAIDSVRSRFGVDIQVSYGGVICEDFSDYLEKSRGSMFHLEIEGDANTNEVLDDLLGSCYGVLDTMETIGNEIIKTRR
ncbi:hypothetical protein CL617_00235 [archaeon]|nr:hypothetical protein [archaeon]|tara:strand:- start:9967 stop:10272 length:306 start_codon:yes stop_codon:yes gene_type:complete